MIFTNFIILANDLNLLYNLLIFGLTFLPSLSPYSWLINIFIFIYLILCMKWYMSIRLYIIMRLFIIIMNWGV